MDQQSEITCTAEFESRLGEIKLPLDDLVPEGIREWQDAFAGSSGTTRELLLCSALVKHHRNTRLLLMRKILK